MVNLVEVSSTEEWNKSLRSATAEGRTVIVDFTASWCPPCKAIGPYFERLATQIPQVLFLRVDVDAQKPIATKYQVTAMPTFIVIKAGKPVDILKGADPYGLNRLAIYYAGPNPPIPPLPADAETAKAAGNEHFRKGEYEQAIEKYTEAISHVPTSAVLFSNRSITHLKKSPPDTALAVDDARQATVHEPKWGKGWLRLGDALFAHGAPKEEVRAAYQTSLENLPDGQKHEVETKLKDLDAPSSTAGQAPSSSTPSSSKVEEPTQTSAEPAATSAL